MTVSLITLTLRNKSMKDNKRKQYRRSRKSSSSSSEELVQSSSESSFEEDEEEEEEEEEEECIEEIIGNEAASAGAPRSPRRRGRPRRAEPPLSAKDDAGLATRAKRIRRGRPRDELDEVRSGEPMRAALAVLDALMKDPGAEVFLKPVNELWSEDDLPGYFGIISVPMDLGTVLKRTKALDYVTERGERLDFDDAAFYHDLRLVFRNAMTYNHPKSDFYRTARRLLALANRKFSVRQFAVQLDTASATRRSSISNISAQSFAEPVSTSVKRQAQKLARIAPPSRSSPSVSIPGFPYQAISESHSQLLSVKIPKGNTGRKPRQAVLKSSSSIKAPGFGSEWKDAEAVETVLNLEENVSTPLLKIVEPQNVVPVGDTASTTPRRKKPTKPASASSISSDEADANKASFAFFSMSDIKKKRGRRSAVVQSLELKHEELMRRRKLLRDWSVQLEQKKLLAVTMHEKIAICEKVAKLDFAEMKQLVDVIASGMNSFEILDRMLFDLDVDKIDDKLFRDIEAFVDNPTVFTALGTLPTVDSELAAVETKLVDARYTKVSQ